MQTSLSSVSDEIFSHMRFCANAFFLKRTKANLEQANRWNCKCNKSRNKSAVSSLIDQNGKHVKSKPKEIHLVTRSCTSFRPLSAYSANGWLVIPLRMCHFTLRSALFAMFDNKKSRLQKQAIQHQTKQWTVWRTLWFIYLRCSPFAWNDVMR